VSAAQDHQEIIIIKRSHDDHDDHHGGAWKIAFADFMTAMFCLFLVLWLVNAANEETKQAVASYFNPVKLVDRNRSVKGLYDAQGIQEIEVIASEGTGKAGSGETDAAGGGQAEKTGAPTGDAEFFADPYESLDQIASRYEAGDAADGEPMSGFKSWSSEQSDAPAETFFDPFAPERWTDMPRQPLSDSPLSETGQPPVPAVEGQPGETVPVGTDPDAEPVPPNLSERFGEPSGETAAGNGERPAFEGDTARTVQSAGPDTAEGATPAETDARPVELAEAEATAGDIDTPPDAQSEPADPVDPSAQAIAEAEQLRTELTDALTQAFGDGNVLVEQLTVEAMPDAILISLTDNLQIPMFEIGSAVPSGPLVVALEKVGGVIGARAGGIRIEGHTDARQFAPGTSDNWQLSGDRARAAYYMLVRGGVPEDRFRAVTGKADRDLADAADPLSARNRRIDILLELGEQ